MPNLRLKKMLITGQQFIQSAIKLGKSIVTLFIRWMKAPFERRGLGESEGGGVR